MKKSILAIFLFTYVNIFAQNINFDDYFIDKTMRLDYIIAGNSEKTEIFFEKLKEEPYWGGSLKNLIDKFNFGDFRILVFDAEKNKLIYSRGYSDLFIEWKFTDEAKSLNRSFYESVVFPFPKNKVIVEIQMRDFKNKFNTVFKMPVDPKNPLIIKDKNKKYEIGKIKYSGDSHKKLDIVIIPDGYTEKEMEKFHNDCKRFADYFFKTEPFKSAKDKVNFWAVDAISEESGTDIPQNGIWKNTVLNTHFYTFGHNRYLTTQDIETVRDIAAYVPYDQIYILVNTAEYGGGGIYNYYNLCSADNIFAEQVFTHEFGHAFAALADEYQYGYEKAEDLYDMTTEPWQVNITNLVDFDSKWKNLVDEDTPVPTPGKPEYRNKIGAFEGAGYVEKEIFRPAYNCKMRSNSTDDFCPVCLKTVIEMLKFYSE